MANDPNPIKLTITATGGDAAAAEIKKVSDAEAGLKNSTEATSAADAAGMDDLTARLDALKERAEALRENTEATKELGEASEDAAEQSSKLDENVSNIARAQKAQAIAQLAGQVAEIGRKFKESGAEIAEFDVELGRSLENTGDVMERVAAGAATLAMGFAIGGPLGGAIAGLAVGLKEAAGAWEDMSIAQAKATRAEAQAVEMAEKLQDALAGGLEFALDAGEASERLTRNYEAETAALDALVDANKRRNQVLDAKGRADAAARDAADDEAIRGGAAPERVKAIRAIDDAELAKAKVDRDVEDKKQIEQAVYKAKAAVDRELQNLQNNPAALPEQLDAAYAKQGTAGTAADAATADRVTAEQVAAERKREIDNRTVAKVADLREDQKNRREREAERLEAERERAEKKAEAERREALRDKLESAEEGLDGSAKAGAASIFGSRAASRNKTARSIGSALENGTNEEEVAKLMRELNEKSRGMNAAMLAALREVLADLGAKTKEVETLRRQVKNKS